MQRRVMFGKQAEFQDSKPTIKERLVLLWQQVKGRLNAVKPRDARSFANILYRLVFSACACALFLAVCGVVAGGFTESGADAYAISALTMLCAAALFFAIWAVISMFDGVSAALDRLLRNADLKDQQEMDFVAAVTGVRRTTRHSRRVSSRRGGEWLVRSTCQQVKGLSLGMSNADENALARRFKEAAKFGNLDLFATEFAPVYEELQDLEKIWQSSFHGMFDVPHAMTISRQSRELYELAQETDVYGKLEAYYAGVPADDVAAV